MSLTVLIPIILKTSIFLTVLGLGLRASGGEVVSLVRNPSRLARSMVAMTIIMPTTAVLLALSFDLHPAVKIALVALSVSPVPPIWPKRAIKTGGDESFTLGLLVTSAAISILFIPIAMAIFERIVGAPLRMSADDIARAVLVTILLPLFLGITVRQLAPGLAADTAKPLGAIGTVLLAAGAIPLVVKLSPAMVSLVGDGTLLAMVAFVMVGLAAGHLLAGPAKADRSVLALACASHHPAIALAIAQVNFPGERLVPAAIVLYLLVAAIVVTPYLKWAQRPEGEGRATKPIPTTHAFRVRTPR